MALLMRVLLILNFVCIVRAVVGHEKLLSSNTMEHQDHAIQFQSPLPSWLNGTLMRNGPGQFEFGTRKVKHPFDGMAKIVKIKFQGGNTALYSTAFINSLYYDESRSANTIAPFMLMMQPDPEFDDIERLEALMNGMDNMNVNIFNMHSAYMATTDTWFMWQINPDTLSTVGRAEAPIPGGGPISGLVSQLSCTHPLPEYGTQNWINWVQELDQNYFQAVRYTGPLERETIAVFESEGLTYMHSFGLTKNYIVFVINPVEMNIDRYMETGEITSSLDWFPERGTKVYVVDIDTGETTTMQTESFVGLHHINAYETENNTIVCDLVSYPDIEILVNSTIDNMVIIENNVYVPSEKAQLMRITIDMTSQSVNLDLIPQTPGLERVNSLDFPCINEAYRFEKYCYVYGFVPKFSSGTYFDTALVKKDLCGTGGDKVWHRANHFMFEPTFIASPSATCEDDGILATVILDGPLQKSYVALFDAQTMTLINEADLPSFVPMPFHGRYFQ